VSRPQNVPRGQHEPRKQLAAGSQEFARPPPTIGALRALRLRDCWRCGRRDAIVAARTLPALQLLGCKL